VMVLSVCGIYDGCQYVCCVFSVELMSALVSCSNLLVIQIETDVYSMLRKVVCCLLVFK